jgi:hypothetical protein
MIFHTTRKAIVNGYTNIHYAVIVTFNRFCTKDRPHILLACTVEFDVYMFWRYSMALVIEQCPANA